ncbi:MAG: CHAD domain-containing protein [Thermoplasmata archaeon]
MTAARRPPRIRPVALVRELERLLAEVAGSVDEVVDRTYPSPESLHHLHREMRRLRHALAIWDGLLTARHRAMVRPLERRLKRLARLVGRVRDRDVMIELIEGASLPHPLGVDVALVARLRAKLRDESRTGRELLGVFLRSERDAHLFEGLREGLEWGTRPGSGAHLIELLNDEQDRRHDDVRAALGKARRRPSTTRLHRLRIRVRRLRHLEEVRARIDGPWAGAFPPLARRLQDRLGRLHDLDVVLAGLDPDLRSTEWARSLKRERRRVRETIRASLDTHPWPEPASPPAVHRPSRARRARS